jgi:hypothetical protein
MSLALILSSILDGDGGELIRFVNSGGNVSDITQASENLIQIQSTSQRVHSRLLSFLQDGQNVLHLLASAGKLELIEFLLDSGVSVNTTNRV